MLCNRLRHNAVSCQLRFQQIAGPAVEPHARYCRLHRIGSLRQQGRDDTGEHIAAAAFGKTAAAGGVHQHLARWGGRYRPNGPFSTSTQPWRMAKSRAARCRSPWLKSPPMRENSTA